METIRKQYAVVENSKASEVEGFVLVSVGRKDKKKGKSGISVQLPVVSDNALQSLLLNPKAADWFRDQVDSLRGKIATALYRADSSIGEEAFFTDALVSAMAADVSVGGARFSKDTIGAWFDVVLVSLIAAKLEAKGVPAGVAEKTLKAFREKFQSLAFRGETFSLDDATADQLTKALALIPEDSEEAESAMVEKLAQQIVKAQGNSCGLDGAL